ncbi:class C sortase [Microbacterium phyllosphaerae]|uniref:class C sortase n=1 Tax=Microbacterium phyllosphaerae TaxID=124798 RepID=UPI003D66102B
MNRSRARGWRPGGFTLSIAAVALGGLVAGLYPMTAQWVSSYNQSLVVDDYHASIHSTDPSAAEQLRQARAYNDALSAGAVRIERNGSRPVSDGATAGSGFDYDSILAASPDGLMGRVRIPSIDVDLPIYHGTSDAVLARGAGHLEGSHFPIGGGGTRAVITAHRGLADARMFTDLDRVQTGDTFTLEVFDEVLTYRVIETTVIEPSEAETVRAVPGEDLVTLITCTPLGINTHRIVVTGERITPTPTRDIEAMAESPDVPGFPWWILWAVAGALGVGAYVVHQGFADARRTQARSARASGSGESRSAHPEN